MIVVPVTSVIHAHTFSKALGCKVSKVTEEIASDPDPWVFLAGVSPDPIIKEIRSIGKKICGYWIGTDSLNAVNQISYRKNIETLDLHLCVHERIQKELKTWGIQSEAVWPCARNYFTYDQVPPLSKEKCVGVYSPTPGPKDLYMHDHVVQLAKENHDLPFLFFGSTYTDLPPNCIDAGRMSPEDTKDLYSKITVLLRLTLHDGNPIGGIEAKIRNLHVIDNFPYDGFLYAKTMEQANEYLRDPIIHEGDFGPWPSLYRERCSPHNFKREIENIIAAQAR